MRTRPSLSEAALSARGVALILLFALTLLCLSPHGVEAANSIVGRWEIQGPDMRIVADFKADGSFQQVITTASGREEARGHYEFVWGILKLQSEGTFMIQQIVCRFQDDDTVQLGYPDGQVRTARRIQAEEPAPAARAGRAATTRLAVEPARPEAQTVPPTTPSPPWPTGTNSPSATAQPAKTLFQRVTEPRENAFTVLVPKGWKTEGGIFNVNPLQSNGPGNSLSPKCDFAVKRDDAGTVMLRWLPTWNYADLSLAPSGGYGLFQPGQMYQGMPVQPMLPPRQFLLDTLRKDRPRAGQVQIIAEDPIPEVSQAFAHLAESVNASLRNLGKAPIRFDSLALLVEYTEDGTRYREAFMTTIADNRSGAFLWSNENTIACRAPAAEFETWKPILDTIRTSREANPEWIEAVRKAAGVRAEKALETQQYINRVANEIVQNRRKTYAEIRHEDHLLLTGQEEYKNPFTGKVERGTSQYRYRWENNQGEVFYTDDNAFDPNRTEEYNSKEWRRSEIWDRRK